MKVTFFSFFLLGSFLLLGLKIEKNFPILSIWHNLDCTIMSCYERTVGAGLPRLIVNYFLQAEEN